MHMHINATRRMNARTTRFLAGLTAVLAAILLLAACGSNIDMQPVKGKVNVVTTLYPLYYFAQQIGGDDAHVVNLVPAGVEPHDWTPKSRDLKIASEAQIFLYNGAGLEGWTGDFLKGLDSRNSRLIVTASEGIPLIQGNPLANNDQGAHGKNALDVDPHTWVSPKSAIRMTENIRDAYIKADPAHREGYETRYNALQERLMALDGRFSTELAGFKGRDIVVSHQAFGYLCRDYGLKQTALMGLSPDAEPRSQDIVNVIKFIKTHQIRAIFFEELVSNRLADTVANETNVQTLVLNPVEGLTPKQEQAGENYFSLMERNLQNLKKALQ
jgi:zinc transport system substrate-binding protein